MYPVLKALLPLFNAVMHSRTMPDSWHISIVKPIYKKGEVDDPSNYRPISLSTSCYRLFMAALTFRLEGVLLEHSIIPDTQYAFTERRNCSHAATVLHHAVLAAGDTTHVAAAFVDLKQAYDRVQHDMLFHTLQVMGIPASFIDVIQKSYDAAQFTVQTSCGFTDLVKYSRGVKQGCPMSPLLFIIYFGIVDSYLTVHGDRLGVSVGANHLLRAIYYADDVVLLAHSMHELQSLFDLFEKCASKLNMMVNPTKSGVMVFNSHSTRTNNPGIMSVKGPISVVKEYCYLGMVLNANFDWEQARLHRADLATRDKDTVISYLKSQHLYHMQALATHFNANVMQTLLYGCPVWGWSYFLSWDLIHNPFQCQLSDLVRKMYKLPVSTPHIAIMCESGVWPILYYAMKQAAKFVDGLQDTNSLILQYLVNLPLHEGVRQKFAALKNRISDILHQHQDMLSPDFLGSLESTYMNILTAKATDPRDPLCQNRKIASYLKWFWNGRLHKRPKFYDMDLNARQYHLCLHTRFLHSYLPVYHQVYKPFLQRVCPLCHSQQLGPCDLRHVLCECPHTLLIYNQTIGELGPEALMFPQLLLSNNADVWKYIATCLQLVLKHVHIRKRNTRCDD